MPDNVRSNEQTDRTLLVNASLDAIYEHQLATFPLFEKTCVDESMSLWYRIDGEYSSFGFLHCVALDHQLENGFEIKSACCGASRVMTWLRSSRQQKTSEGKHLRPNFLTVLLSRFDRLSHGSNKTELFVVNEFLPPWQVLSHYWHMDFLLLVSLRLQPVNYPRKISLRSSSLVREVPYYWWGTMVAVAN